MEENRTEEKEGMTPNRINTLVSAVLFLALVGAAASLFIMMENGRKEADARINGLTQNLEGMGKELGTVRGALESAREELKVFDQLKTSLDSMLGEFSNRVAVVEEKVPEQEEEIEEFSTQVRELNKSVEQLASAIAVIKSERVTQEQLAVAKDQLTQGVEGMKTAVKKLDKAHGAVVYRVRKLEKFQKETGATLLDLSEKLTGLTNATDALRIEFNGIKERPAAPKDDFKFVPSEPAGGGEGQPTDAAAPADGAAAPAPEAAAPAPEAAPAPAQPLQ